MITSALRLDDAVKLGIPVTALVLMLLTAMPGSAQVSAQGRATLHVGDVLTLRVAPGGGVSVLSADGVFREQGQAVRLEVTANRGWRLMVRAEGTGQAVASAGSVGEMARPMWWRVSDLTGQVTAQAVDFVPAQAWSETVAEGGPGRATAVVLDYRWLDSPGFENFPGVVLSFTLSGD